MMTMTDATATKHQNGQPDFDAWSEVVNGPHTYAAIAESLQTRGSMIVGWTDGHSSHHDVLFTLCPSSRGQLQGGLRGGSDLFVSIMRRSCFGFDIASIAPRHPNYVAEKLGLQTRSVTTEALAELLNGVIAELAKVKP